MGFLHFWIQVSKFVLNFRQFSLPSALNSVSVAASVVIAAAVLDIHAIIVSLDFSGKPCRFR